jgi:hypothetical protein
MAGNQGIAGHVREHVPLRLLVSLALLIGATGACGNEPTSDATGAPTTTQDGRGSTTATTEPGPEAEETSESTSSVSSTTDTTHTTESGSGASETSGDIDSAASCVSEYSADTLGERAFAFDGTVVELRSEHDPRGPEQDVVTTRALFEVHEWFAGGSDGAALVWMMREVTVGERLLVTGEPRWGGEPLEDAIAWECGFTTEHSEARAAEWGAAFPGS